MTDRPSTAFTPEKQILSTCGISSAMGRMAVSIGGTLSAGAWPAANRALYVPVELEFPATAYQMSFVVGTQSGNYDIGIYDETGNALARRGSTAVPVAGLATWDLTDFSMLPGLYFIALNIDNVTATVNRNNFGGTAIYQACGLQQQALGSVALPAATTFANPATAYLPDVRVHLFATV